jgi:formamidopyrimidine-DNA glycosylase
MKSRVTLVRWLYSIHNKVNKKLNINTGPTLKQVWDKYESFRSKCTKSPEIVEKIKTGCLDPLKGYRKKCVIDVIDVDEKGNEFGKKVKSSTKKQIKLVSIKKSTRPGKKLMATFDVGGKKRIIHFGFSGMSDNTKHKNKERRNRYIFRHHKDLGTGNPTRAGYLSMFILWNKKTLSASIADYRRRLATYNRTGKFPTKITGYK